MRVAQGMGEGVALWYRAACNRAGRPRAAMESKGAARGAHGTNVICERGDAVFVTAPFLLAWKGRRVAATVLQWSQGSGPHPPLSFHVSLSPAGCPHGPGYSKAQPNPRGRGVRGLNLHPAARFFLPVNAGVPGG